MIILLWGAFCQGGFCPVPLVSSTNKTDNHDITEILLKVALNKLTQTFTLITGLKNYSLDMYILDFLFTFKCFNIKLRIS